MSEENTTEEKPLIDENEKIPVATVEDMDDVFAHLDNTIFKFKSCLFRISHSSRSQKCFHAEMINDPSDIQTLS